MIILAVATLHSTHEEGSPSPTALYLEISPESIEGVIHRICALADQKNSKLYNNILKKGGNNRRLRDEYQGHGIGRRSLQQLKQQTI